MCQQEQPSPVMGIREDGSEGAVYTEAMENNQGACKAVLHGTGGEEVRGLGAGLLG